MQAYYINSTIGGLLLTVDEERESLTGLRYIQHNEALKQPDYMGEICLETEGDMQRTEDGSSFREVHPTGIVQETVRQLREYFAGERRKFELKLQLTGTAFQLRVWDALQSIPYGETKSYRYIAERIGSPKAYRAVGGANHKNPVMIIVPCHRVIGADGSMTGFGCGINIKEQLLELERSNTLLC